MSKMRKWMVDRRAELSLTQSQVALMCGFSRQYYSALEQGLRGTKMNAKLLNNISDALEINIGEAVLLEKQYAEYKK